MSRPAALCKRRRPGRYVCVLQPVSGVITPIYRDVDTRSPNSYMILSATDLLVPLLVAVGHETACDLRMHGIGLTVAL